MENANDSFQLHSDGFSNNADNRTEVQTDFEIREGEGNYSSFDPGSVNYSFAEDNHSEVSNSHRLYQNDQREEQDYQNNEGNRQNNRRVSGGGSLIDKIWNNISETLYENPQMTKPIQIIANRFKSGIEANPGKFNKIDESCREIMKYAADFLGDEDNEKRTQWILLGADLAFNKLKKQLKKDRDPNEPADSYEIESLREVEVTEEYISDQNDIIC